MAQTPGELLAKLEETVRHLGDPNKAIWLPGRCTRNDPPTGTNTFTGTMTFSTISSPCTSPKHPNGCEGAWDVGDLEPLPDKPTVKQMREAFLMMRGDVAEALDSIIVLIKGQQSQVVFLDKFAKGHRHKVGEGHFSDKAE